jgi:hypothetical protein
MDKNNVDVIAEAFQARQYRILPPSASTGYGDGLAGQVILGEEEAAFGDEIRRDGNDDAVDGRGGDKGPDGMNQDGDAGQEMVLFGVTQAHSGSASGGGDNNGGRWHGRGRKLQVIVYLKSCGGHEEP